MSAGRDAAVPTMRDHLAMLRVTARGRLSGWTPEATIITTVILVLVVFGLVMSFSASFVDAAEEGNPFGVFRRQALWALLGLLAFAFVVRIPPKAWRTASWLLFGASLLGLVAVLIPGIGVEAFGSRRWIALGPIVVQPSELAKLGLLLWLADVLERKRRPDGEPHEVRHLLVPALPALGLIGLLVLLEPDLGTTILLGGIVMLVLFAEGLPLRHIGGLVAAGAVGVLALAIVEPYRFARLTGWWNPEADPEASGWQLLQSLYALGSGGWLGLGLGSSRGKWNFIPNPETDFIFAIIGEELGLVGALTVVLAFTTLLVLGLRVARMAPTGFAATVAFAITGWLVGQALLNIGTVTGLLPITGVTLPLVSVGGSSLVSTLVALGILVAIARTIRQEGQT